MNIGVVCWSLLENLGGIERVGCDLASALRLRGHNVTLVCKKMRRKAKGPTARVPEGVNVLPLALDVDVNNLDQARKALAGQKLDVLAALFSWESLLWVPGLVRGLNLPLLMSEHNAPQVINSKWNAFERHCCLDCADVIHVLLGAFVNDYPARLRPRITVVPNAAAAPAVLPSTRRDGGRKTVIAAGRFAESRKRFSLLLKAFALLKDRRPDWDLEICGDGEAMAEYRQLAEKLALGQRLRLPGMLPDLAPRFAAADIFCIPSQVEGFGMVTVEAQAQELPAVGFAACPGVNEVIVHNENGLLAEEMTPECLARALETLMADAGLRQRLGERGREMLARYSPDKVYGQWEEMLIKTAARKGGTRIQEILDMPDAPDADILDADAPDADARAARELLERAHPFDRSRYLALHKSLKEQGRASPFSEKEIAGFRKKQKLFGFPGYRSPLVEVERWLRKLRNLWLT